MKILQKKVALSNELALNVTEWIGPVPPYNPTATLLLIHGSGDASCIWQEVVGSLASQYRALSVDLRGHGDSDWAPDGNYAADSMAADLAELLQKLALDGVTLIGHSLGGEVALRLAAAHPSRIERLVLVDFGPEMQDENVTHIRDELRATHRLYQSADEYAAVLQNRHPMAAPALLHRIAAETTRPAAGGIRLKYDPAFIAGQDTQGWRKEARDTARLWESLSQLRCPMLVMRGIASSVLTRPTAEKMVRDYPSRRTLAVIPGAGHSIQIDSPDGFTSAIEQFLRSTNQPVVALRAAGN